MVEIPLTFSPFTKRIAGCGRTHFCVRENSRVVFLTPGDESKTAKLTQSVLDCALGGTERTIESTPRWGARRREMGRRGECRVRRRRVGFLHGRAWQPGRARGRR